MTVQEQQTRLRLKHAMTATAFAVVQARNAWRMYFAGLRAERLDKARRERPGWGG